ncbi:MAG: MBG domain-containing protein [Blautia wexlerae]
MKKKLLAGIMALALCSTSIPQMIFAEEFTSGVLEETTPEETEEIPEVFTDENQAAAGDEIGGVSEFSSEEVPEFDDESDNAAVATDGGDTTATSPIEISINSPSNPSDPTSGYTYDSSTSICTINKPGSYRFTGNGETSNRIVIDNITSGTVNIYLNNVSISTDVGPALLINQNVTVQVYIHLEGTNTLKTTSVLSAALQKDNLANLTIDNAASNSTGNTGSLTAAAAANSANGAGIGGGANGNGNGSNITISGGSVIAYSNGFGSGIGGGAEGNGSGITISGGLVKAYSNGFGSGIGGGCEGNGSDITISGGSVTAYSHDDGSGIGGGSRGNDSRGNGSYITISGGSVKAYSEGYGSGIGGGDKGNGSYIAISDGSVTAYSTQHGSGIGGGYNGNGSGITISGGSVTYSERNGSGIGGGYKGNGSNITISGGSVTAYSHGFDNVKGSDIGGGYNGNSNNIYISGGSVKAQTLDYTPVKSANENISVYRYDISNPDRSNIGIDGNNWTPSIHSDNDKTLYAWLTGEDHYITVGSEKKAYIFDSASETFSNTKRTLSSSDFQFAAPENLTYNNCVKSATVEVKNGIKGVENITVKYFLGDTLVSDPINVGTYTVKIDVDGSDFNNPTQNLTDENWTFTISRGSISNSSIEITPYSGTYDGNPHEIISSITGYPGGSTIEYSTDNSNWQSNCPTVTSVDDATNTSVFVRVSNSNYNPWSSSTPLKAKITPKKITIAIDGKEKKYGEDNPGFTFKLQDSTQLIGEDTKDSLGVKLATTANNSSPVTDNGYPISVESWTNTNYDIIASNGTLTIKKSNQTPNLPKPTQTQKSVLWSCKKVSDITGLLPEHWNWADSSKELQVGANSVTAVYTGKDKGNYETEAVIYTITRENCNHPHTVDRYYSSASCTSSGYSGDTYCTDCGALVSYGYTISAYGHSYDDGVITTEPTTETEGTAIYTCKRCKHQETRTLGKLNDGEPYIEGDFLKKGWDSVREIIKKSKEKDLVSITLNGAQTLPVSVLSELKGKDIDLSLNMENGFIWKINGTLITAEAPADVDLSVAKATDYIPASLYKLISTNQNDFAFHLGASGAFNFPMVLSVKADASCAGLMANLFWYDAQSQVLQCIQSVTVSGALERSIPYADFTLSKGQDYFVVFATESFNGKSIHMDGSITDENGSYLRPADTSISSCSIDRNKLTVKLTKGCAGAQGYDFVVGKSSNMTQTGKFSKTVSSQSKPQASFKYLAKGTWYVAARSWVLDAQGNKVYGSWTKIKKIKITVVTPQQPKIKDITVKENTVTVTYTKCKNATGYEILLGNKYKTSAGEKYPVKKYVKRTEGKNTVTVTFTIVKKGTWYVTVRSWNKTSKNKSRVYSPYSDIKKFKVKK